MFCCGSLMSQVLQWTQFCALICSRRPLGAAALLRRSLLIYGVGGVIAPFIGIKLIDVLLAILQQLGVQTASLLTLLGAAGLAVALSLQGSLANFASGLLVLSFRMVRVGDQIEIGELLPGGFRTVFVIRDRIVGDKPRAVAEELVDGDRPLAVVVEFGQQAAEPVAQPQLALFDQDHDRGRRGDRLGERGHVEDRVARHRFRRRTDGATPGRAGIGDESSTADQDDRAGDLPALDGPVDGAIDPLEPARIEAQGRRIGRR